MALADPQVLNLLNAFKPFLGQRGRQMVEVTETVGELVASETAQKALHGFRSLTAPAQVLLPVAQELTANPFTIFLILVLLLLADTAPAKGPGSQAVSEA